MAPIITPASTIMLNPIDVNLFIGANYTFFLWKRTSKFIKLCQGAFFGELPKKV